MTDSGKHTVKEPFVRIVKKGLPSPARAIGVEFGRVAKPR